MGPGMRLQNSRMGLAGSPRTSRPQRKDDGYEPTVQGLN